jgi:hypothetical protein
LTNIHSLNAEEKNNLYQYISVFKPPPPKNVIKAHISSLNNKLKKKIGLGSSGSYIFFSPGIAVNGAGILK